MLNRRKLLQISSIGLSSLLFPITNLIANEKQILSKVDILKAIKNISPNNPAYLLIILEIFDLPISKYSGKYTRWIDIPLRYLKEERWDVFARFFQIFQSQQPYGGIEYKITDDRLVLYSNFKFQPTISNRTFNNG